MDLGAVAPYLVGPGAGLVICVLVGFAAYQVILKVFVPMLEGWISRHLKQIDDMSARWDAADLRRSEEHQRIIYICERIHDRLDREVTNPGVGV